MRDKLLLILFASTLISSSIHGNHSNENPLVYHIAASILTQYLPEITEEVCLITIGDEDICTALIEAVSSLVALKGVDIYKKTVRGIHYVVKKGTKYSTINIETETYRNVSLIKKGLEYLINSNCIPWKTIECLSCLDDNIDWDLNKAGFNGEFFGTYTDLRNNKQYPVFFIDNQIWFVNPINFDDNYDYLEKFDTGYYTGGYRLDQNVCPDGWKVPSKNDIKELFDSYDINLRTKETIIEKLKFESMLSTGIFMKESGYFSPTSESFWSGGYDIEYSTGKQYWLEDGEFFKFNYRYGGDYFFEFIDSFTNRMPCLCTKDFTTWTKLKKIFGYE